MQVSEVFCSLQGEGVFQGLPTVFVRLAGCNLIPHCSYCDTAYSQSPDSGQGISIEGVVKEVSELLPYYKSWVCITGGEPLWQVDEVEALVRALKRAGYQTTIETNGSFGVPRWYTLVDSWSADIKCPSSGVCGVSRKDWWGTRFSDQIKFVVGTREDLDFAAREIEQNLHRSPQVLISPMMKREEQGGEVFVVNRKFLREVWAFCLRYRVRWSLQQHKVVFGDKKGV